jgi:hypothetical protein
MRKIIFFISIIFIFLFNNNAISQVKNSDYNQPKHIIGIELGPSLTNFVNGDLYSGAERIHEYKMGYFGGVIFQYNLNSYISFRTNIDYEKKIIADQVYQINYVKNEYEYAPWCHKYDYINVPVLAKLNLRKNRFFVDAGPYLDILLNSEFSFQNPINNETVIRKGTKDIKKLNLGLAAGLGANIPIGKKYDMSFEARDNLNLTYLDTRKIFKNVNNSSEKRSKISLNTVLFLYSLTYHIPEKK